MSKHVMVNGIECRVTDNLGYQGGYYVKEVVYLGEPQMAVAPTRSGPWRLWTADDRLGVRSNVTGQ